jgi:hypothetical protein
VEAFRQDLKLTVSNKNGKTGAQILDDVLVWAQAAGAVPSATGARAALADVKAAPRPAA